MDKSQVFCVVPWLEVHINADGTYHSCGAQPHPGTNKYNVFNMSVAEWVNSEYQKTVRLNKLQGIPDPKCNMCYQEEAAGSSSKRLKENHKCDISAGKEFPITFQRSRDYKHFEYSAQNQGFTTQIRPESYHIAIGNECNYACRMCTPWASSKLAAEGIKEGTYSGPVLHNWTRDQKAWDSVTDYICSTDNLKFVHIIGGEPLLSTRFEELIDKLIAANKTDIYLGFTTNGSIFNQALVEKLNVFRHVDIGISVEATGILNEYIRRGTDTKEVLDNIDLYLKYRSESHVYVTLRVVPSAMNVHTLDDLYKWAAARKLDVVSNILVNPAHLQIRHLPDSIKAKLLEQYSTWEYCEPLPGNWNPRDPNRFREHIDSEIRAIINNLKTPGDPSLTKQMYESLQQWGWFNNPEINQYFFTGSNTDNYVT